MKQLAAVLLLIISGPVLSASFDCAKAGTGVEKTICSDAELSRLDELLGLFYYGALDFVKQSPCLKNEQREWLSKTRNRCKDAACLRNAYLLRLGALVGVQPGMSIPKNLALPPTPRLRWIIPVVESDTPVLDSKPFQANGVIDYELNKGGFVLRTGDGQAHTLIPEMIIDGDSNIHLGVLKDMKTNVTVSGRHAVVNKTEQMFDNRHCIVIQERP